MSYLHHFSAEALPGQGAASSATMWQVSLPTEPDSVSPHVSQQFLGLLKAYRHSGGLLRAQEAAARCKPRSGTPVHTLAGWICHRKVVSFEWLSRIWLPVFQFNRTDMSRQSGLDEVLAELVTIFDDWEIAQWFAAPNPWLGNLVPANLLATAAPDLVQAARADRFAIAG
ncbi:hypothetical protein HUU62_25080 [Rhodoferax sp. 4810]|nr:hypothetical protein [Rhodoferax jenense]